jgi:ABC-type branched-subunit amino acid transport system substrate-binding protein
MRAPGRSWMAVVCLAAVAAACGGSSGSSTSKSPYLLAFISDLTGAAASQSQPFLNGFKTYIDWTNDNGGANGHRVQVSVTDDAYDVAKGKIAIQAAQASGALGVFGGAEPAVWGPNAALAPQTQMLQLTVGMTESFAVPPQPYLYLMSTTSSQNGTGMINLLQAVIKAGDAPAKPSVSIIRFASPGVQATSTFMQAQFKTLGWNFVGEQTYALTATDVSSQASQVVQAKPDVVFAPAIDSQAPLVIKALRQKGFTGPVIGFQGASTDGTFAALADPRYYAFRTFVLPGTAGVQGAMEEQSRAKSSGNTVNIGTAQFSQGYVMGLLAVLALQKCADPCDGPKYNDAMGKLGKVDTRGLNPDIAITPERHVVIGAVMPFKWDAGKSAAVAMGTWLQLA